MITGRYTLPPFRWIRPLSALRFTDDLPHGGGLRDEGRLLRLLALYSQSYGSCGGISKSWSYPSSSSHPPSRERCRSIQYPISYNMCGKSIRCPTSCASTSRAFLRFSGRKRVLFHSCIHCETWTVGHAMTELCRRLHICYVVHLYPDHTLGHVPYTNSLAHRRLFSKP